MPVSDTNILAPAAVKSRVPLKKSTIVWGVGVVVLLAVIGVFAPSMNKSNKPDASAVKNEKVDKPEVQSGDPRMIDNEVKAAAEKEETGNRVAAMKKQAADEQARLAGTAPSASQQVGASAGGGQATLPAASGIASLNRSLDGTPANVNSEYEAAARTSSSLKYDEGVSGAGSAGGNSVSDITQKIQSMIPDAGGAGNASSAPPAGPDISSILAAVAAGKQGAPTTGAGVDKAWMREMSAQSEKESKAIKPYPLASQYTLLQGKVIPAVLGRDLNSDLPGVVTAYTTMDIYDSISSRNLLMPKGSALVGQYQSEVRAGQERLMFGFTRIMLPNGTSLDLPGNPGADMGGAAGISGEVNNHFFKMFTQSLLIAVMADKVAPTTTSASGTTTTSPAGQVLLDVSKTILERQKTIPPTITIGKGTRINVEVTRDMEFQSSYRN
jgi:type IV secretory pathway VirB10-like protein